MAKNQLLYAPLEPIIETAFWHKLAQQKINVLKLDNHDLPLKIEINSASLKNSNKIYFNFDSLPSTSLNPHGHVKIENTIEAYKASSKQNLLNLYGQRIFGNLNLETLNSLYNILLYCFIDLKKWHFTYWASQVSVPKKYFDHDITLVGRINLELSSTNYADFLKNSPNFENFCCFCTETNKFSELPELGTQPNDTQIFCFIDSSRYENAVSIIARNFAYFISKSHGLKKFKILALRKNEPESLIFEVQVNSIKTDLQRINFTGWLKNKKTNNLQATMIDLSALMDKKQLAANAADLNLKLMKWRVNPNLDLQKIQQQKALLLGAGTLGSNVARNLIGWGIKHITFVDCGKVSYSNPVRQSLW